MSPDGFEIFYVKFQMPKFGTEGEFQEQEQLFIVSTQGGREDARQTCERYHKNCRITSIQSRMEELCGVKVPLKKKTAKKGK